MTEKKRHIVVTGGAGFIGSHMAQRLLQEGYEVTVLDNLSTGDERNIPQGARFIKVDLGQESACEVLAPIQCDAVFHLAGQSSGENSFKDPLYDLRSHVLSTFFLLQWCKQKGIDRFLYASSMATYGDPQYLPVDENHAGQPKTYYASAKLAAEAYIKFYQTRGTNCTIFRLFSVYGPGQNLKNKDQGMASIYMSYILENKPVIVKGSPERFRDLVYIDDVINAWMMAFSDSRSYGQTFNLASGKKTHVKDLLAALLEISEKPDYPIQYLDNTPGDQFGIYGSAEKIKSILGWEAKTELRHGLRTMFNFEKTRIGN